MAGRLEPHGGVHRRSTQKLAQLAFFAELWLDEAGQLLGLSVATLERSGGRPVHGCTRG
jgi:hypothetical protein